jgi:uncharacterized membrane protein
VSDSADSFARIERWNYVVGGILCVAAAITATHAQALGIVVGVALTCLNFAALRRLVFRWTTDTAAGASSNRIALVMPKMILLMVAVVLALKFLPISAPAFAIGYSVFVVSIVIELIYTMVAPPPSRPDGANENNENIHG